MPTQSQIAEHLDLSTRRVRTLVGDGIIPSGKGTGGFDVDACRLAYIRYLRGVSSGQVKVESSHEISDDDYARLLEKEKHRKAKRENDIEEGEVAPIELLTVALEKTAAQIIPIMDAMPLEMKRRNPKLTGHDIQLVKKSIAKCRNIMADTKIDLE